MAQTIKLKRSAVAGRIPTLNSLDLGEVAINTTDGKMYMKKSVSGVESIVEITAAQLPADPTFDSVTLTGAPGPIEWNSDESTVDVPLNSDVTLQMGQETLFYAKATEAISNGDVVMFAGAQGDHLMVSKADMSLPQFEPEYVIGIATQDFALNDFGFVTTFGKVRGLNTAQYTEGDVLYLDPSVSGGLTTTRPTPTDHIIQMCAVTRSHITEGTFLVRPTHFHDTDEVPEGADNLYFTDQRVFDAADSRYPIKYNELTNEDLNDLTSAETGFYFANNSYAGVDNIPYNNYFTMLHIRNPFNNINSAPDNNDRASQLWFGDTPGGGIHWRAYQGNGTWHDWAKVYDDNYHPISWSEITDKPTIDNSVDYINAASFNTSTGVLALSGVGRAGASVDLDGRYLQMSNYTDDYVSSAGFNTSTGVLTLTRVEGGTVTVDLDGRYLQSETDSQTLSWNGSNGQLSISNGNTVDLDGRYLQSFSETDTLDSVTDRGNTTTNNISVGSITTQDSITFNSPASDSITATMLDGGTLSFSGASGQLFSISDTLEGTIFSVNDVSGIPSIEVEDDGTIRLAEFSGNTLIGTDVDNGTDKLQVTGSVSATEFNGSLDWSNVTNAPTSQSISFITGLQSALDNKVDDSQVLTNVPANAVFTDTETTTNLSIVGNELRYVNEEGTTQAIDLSLYLDDTNAAYIESGVVDSNGIATFTRDDNSSFTVDMSVLLDDTNLSRITSAAWNTSNGVLTLTRNDSSTVEVDLDNRYLPLSGGTVTGQLTVGSTTNKMRLSTQNGTPNIADSFADTTTHKSYIFFDAVSGSSDPGFIMHETSESEHNEGVIHLCPSDDNAVNDYVSIHGTNDPDRIKLHTSGLVEGITDLTASGTITATSFSGNLDYNDITNPPVIDNSVDYINAASFNTSTGILTLSGVGRAGATIDLDGRYLQSETDSQTLSWNGSNGQLSISNGNTVDLDGRYLQSYTETDTLSSVTSRGRITSNRIVLSNTATIGSSVSTMGNASLLVGSEAAGIGIDNNEIMSSGGPFYIGTASGNNSDINFRRDGAEKFLIHGSGASVTGNLSVSGTITGSIDYNDITNPPIIDNSVDYINAASFNTSNGVLTLSGVGRAGAAVDLDNRYKINNNTYRWSLDSVGNITDSRYYKLATVNIGNGGLRIEGTFSNHVESFGTQTVDLSIFGRELNSNIDIEIAGSIDVAASGTGTGIYVIKATDSSVYHTYDVYAVIPKYSQVELDLTKTGITSLHLPSSTSFVTTKPSGISVELDASLLSEGSYVVQDSEIYENYHTGNLNPVTGLTHDTVNTELDITFADGTTQSLDLSQYIDDTNLARILSGSHVGSGIVRFTRDDSTTFDVDLSDFFDDTNLSRIVSASWNTSNGVLTLTRNDSTTVTVDLDGRYYNTGESDGRYVRKTGDTMTGNLGMNNNKIVGLGAIVLNNREGSDFGTVSGTLMFDENFYSDAEYGATWSGSNGGGISIYNEDGWGRVLTDRNAQWHTATFGGLKVGSNTVFHDGYHPNADKWTTARTHTVTLTGEVTGSASQSVDGTGNSTWTISTTLNNDALNDQFVQQLPQTSSPNYTTPSSRRVDPNTTNPTNEHYAISTFGNDGNVTGQLATHFVSGQAYTRGHNNGWSSWRKIWDSQNFDPATYDNNRFVRKTGDTMTGDLTMGPGTKIHLDSVGQEITFGQTPSQVGYIRQDVAGQIQIGSDNEIAFYETDANTQSVLIETNTGNINANGTITANNFVGSINYSQITNPPVIDNSVDYINAASFNTSTGVLTLSGVGRAGATVDLDNRYQLDSTPAAPSITSTTVVGETIEVVFSQSSSSGIDRYEVWSNAAGSSYGLIAIITPEDFAASMSVVDSSFNTAGTVSYRVYAIRNGIASTAATTSQVFTAPTLDVTNMVMLPQLNTYILEYDLPESRFLDHVEIYVDIHESSASISRTNATLAYSGNRDAFTYNINSVDMNKFHQFWVECVI